MVRKKIWSRKSKKIYFFSIANLINCAYFQGEPLTPSELLKTIKTKFLEFSDSYMGFSDISMGFTQIQWDFQIFDRNLWILPVSLNSCNFFVRHPFPMYKVALESPGPDSFISGLTFIELVLSSEIYSFKVSRILVKSTFTTPH